MIIKWYGTAALSFSDQKESVLFDPFLPLNKNLLPSSVEIFRNYTNIFITHGHFDHVLPLPLIASLGKATIYCNQATATSLFRDGVKKTRLCVIKPGDKFNLGDFEITVYRGKHIRFDANLIVKTLFSKNTLKNLKALNKIVELVKKYPAGEVFIYGLKTANKDILHLGSFNFDRSEKYPPEPDLLTLPYQGRSDLVRYALPFIEELNPGALLLHHFDDSFPPVSSKVNPEPFKDLIASLYPAMKVYVPTYNRDLTI